MITKTIFMRQSISFLVVFVTISLSAFAQAPASPPSPYISPEAFRKMMQDHYRFTVVGSQTPVSGLKVETTTPSISLKGNILSSHNQSFIANLELQGGLNDGIMQLFSGKKASGYFKGTLGFNFLFSGNRAWYNALSSTERDMTRHAIRKNQKALIQQMDSFMVIQILTDNQQFHLPTFSLNNFIDAVYLEAVQERNELHELKRLSVRDMQGWRVYFEELILAMLVKYGADSSLSGQARFEDFRIRIANVDDPSIKTKDLLQDYDRLYDLLQKGKHTFNDRESDFEIALTKFNWNLKLIRWFNVSLTAGNARFWLYDGAKQNVIDTNSFTRDFSLSYNLFFKWKEPHRYLFVRPTFGLKRMNNLTDLSKFDYKQETIINATPGVLTSKKEGTAYQGELNQKIGYDFSAETYVACWRSEFIPGIYAKPLLRHSRAWVNPTQLSLDFGLVWNITSSDKEAKNLLTIVPYVSWSNLLPAYNRLKTELEPLSDRFSFNVKFGVPFNLGK